MKLTPGQVERISQLSDQWSFLWDKRRAVWIAAEDCPDGEQVEEDDLNVLLARLLLIAPAQGQPQVAGGSAAGVQQGPSPGKGS